MYYSKHEQIGRYNLPFISTARILKQWTNVLVMSAIEGKDLCLNPKRLPRHREMTVLTNHDSTITNRRCLRQVGSKSINMDLITIGLRKLNHLFV